MRNHDMKSLRIICVSLLLIAVALGFPQRPAISQVEGRYGDIEGVVITGEGKPVAAAKVYVFEIGGSPVANSDENGRFKFKDVVVGRHLVLAYKESDGFPNPVWSFYSHAPNAPQFPAVDVRGNETVSVMVRLGPRASQLLISLIDANTKQVISDAEVVMNHVKEPKTLLKSGSNQTSGPFRFNLLVPPLVPINLEISAPGYKNWRYRSGASKSKGELQLEPGSVKRITVQLQPSRRAR